MAKEKEGLKMMVVVATARARTVLEKEWLMEPLVLAWWLVAPKAVAAKYKD